jgi:hypothetical protein
MEYGTYITSEMPNPNPIKNAKNFHRKLCMIDFYPFWIKVSTGNIPPIHPPEGVAAIAAS